MTRRDHGGRPSLARLLLVLLVCAAPARGASDPRFFGDYCGSHVERRRLFGFLPITLTKTFTIQAHADYREPAPGQGGVLGHGTVHWDDKTALFVFEADVTARGYLEGSGISNVLGRRTASATLDEAGTEMMLTAFGRTVRLRKADCHNTPPTATIVIPAPGTHVPMGEPIRLAGSATDAEDSAIAWTRFVWTSDRDGLLGRGPTLEHTPTATGPHTITLTVTDHGGLSGAAAIQVDVLNNAPHPMIERPLADGRYYVGAPILFRGIATDVDVGFLRGDQLEWSTPSLGRIGTGQSFTRNMPAGEHEIVLLARDGALAPTTSVHISVRPPPPHGPGTPSRFTFPPTVHITAPVDESEVVIPLGGCVTLRATATDVEDGTGPFHLMSPDAIQWEQTIRLFGPPEGTRRIGQGDRVEFCSFSLGQHDVTARVTDSGGATAADTIHFTVRRMP